MSQCQVTTIRMSRLDYSDKSCTCFYFYVLSNEVVYILCQDGLLDALMAEMDRYIVFYYTDARSQDGKWMTLENVVFVLETTANYYVLLVWLPWAPIVNLYL